MQVNRVAPPLWLIILIFLVRYLYSQRVVVQLVTPVSNILVLIVVLTYINDTDLYMFNNGGDSAASLVVKV